MVPKMQTDISVLSGATGASITPKKRIPTNKRKIKLIATSPPRKDPIPNQDKSTLGIEIVKVFHHKHQNFLLDLNH